VHVDSYSFGRITVDGREYDSDLIIYPDRIDGSWWRKKSHKLYAEDIREALEAKPDVLVVGTGNSGRMSVTPQVGEEARKRGIELIAKKTAEAVRDYNSLSRGKRTVAALHLTC